MCFFQSKFEIIPLTKKFAKLIKSLANFFVDLEGFEPSSKRGINLLSTCLSLLYFSTRHKTKATNAGLIPLISSETQDFFQTISDITALPWSVSFEARAPGNVSFQLLEPE
ncbi:MAG: hypothetical protein EZS26_001160 [Candidatus Ordinivivax streblomastigis]|uniref:Uncharacterized protein n=1 Tax=Candidatus Ordinivivax streblomastigis TaxID=2540710 RepID=A0A5M8P2I4_9BACT|nr:MAG: hypothetical protein EZS26_001160 [Candidatus Ordinivivax streblomastigis]